MADHTPLVKTDWSHMRRMSESLSTVVLLVLIMVFAASGLDKAFHYEGFLAALRSYVMVPDALAPNLAGVIILSEILIALGLISSRNRGLAAGTGAVLLVLFSVALGVNRYFDPAAPCGCWFTITLGESTTTHIAQNLLLAGMSATACWERYRSATPSSQFT